MLRRVETNSLKTKEVQPFAAQMDETPLHLKREYDCLNHIYSYRGLSTPRFLRELLRPIIIIEIIEGLNVP